MENRILEEKNKCEKTCEYMEFVRCTNEDANKAMVSGWNLK
jgi:hypothetical protein